MNPLSSELPFHVHNWLIISLKDFCIVIRKWPTFWPSRRKASVSEMLHNLGWQSLDSRRQDQRLVLFYKIINGLVDWLALHLKFGSVYFQQFGGISRPHVDQLQI